jgi:hypothetical protein
VPPLGQEPNRRLEVTGVARMGEEEENSHRCVLTPWLA